MSVPGYRVRRATVDDLPALLALWASMSIPSEGLERRVTEFQIVETEDGNLLGALGLEIVERHGRLHSEAFSDFSQADDLRQLLWARMQSVFHNYGLVRAWICESAPFWKQNGFHPPNAETAKKLAPAWAALQCDWLTLELRDEEVLRTTLEKEFTRIKQVESPGVAGDPLRPARVLNQIATALGIILTLVVLVFCFLMLRNGHLLPHK